MITYFLNIDIYIKKNKINWRLILPVIISVFIFSNSYSNISQQSSGVVINRQPLTIGEVNAIQYRYNYKIPNGRYWYDTVSGLWGYEGGPAMGRTVSGIHAFGSMPQNISKSKTGIIINGREIHKKDLEELQKLFGSIKRARYWLNSRGRGGFENGPEKFDIITAIKSVYGIRRNSSLLGGYFITQAHVIGY